MPLVVSLKVLCKVLGKVGYLPILISLTVGVGVIGGLVASRPLATTQPVVAKVESGAESKQAPARDPQAEWEAQQQRVSSVLQSMDRQTLIGNSPTKGAVNAPIVLIIFSDFQCPYCAAAAEEMKTFTAAHETDVLYVYKHFPLTSIHPEALPAAKAAWAAQQQGEFWAYYDALFANRERLGDGLYLELATTLGLDLVQFNRDRNRPAATVAIEQDRQLAMTLQLRGTPTFLMNNLLIPSGLPFEAFEQVLTQMKKQLSAESP